MKLSKRFFQVTFLSIVSWLQPTVATAQEASLKKALGDQNIAQFWTYDNLELGLKKAKETQKPLLVTIRCVPCHACRGMDQQVVNPTDLTLLSLMNEFVCVRVVQAWGLDLSIFQYDMNQSWAAFLMNADGTIYGRYGTRAAQRNDKAITVEGFNKALEGALELHRRYLVDPASLSQSLNKKKGPTPRWDKPDDIPVIQNTVRWGKPLGRMTGKAQAECLHCHFVPAANMMSLMDAGEPITDQTLWAYPLPETVGLSLDPKEKATITQVRTDSQADRSGFRAGDQILQFNEQPIVSIADIQWVLHQASENDSLQAVISRNNQILNLSLELEPGWRRWDEFVSRVSSWDFFKVKIFGVNQMDALTQSDKAKLGLPAEQSALRIVKLAPGWGDMNHDVRKAGVAEGDIIIQVDNEKTLSDHSELLAYLVQQKRPGDSIRLTLLRDGKRRQVSVPLNWSNKLKALRKP